MKRVKPAYLIMGSNFALKLHLSNIGTLHYCHYIIAVHQSLCSHVGLWHFCMYVKPRYMMDLCVHVFMCS